VWADAITPHGRFCGLLRRAQRVCAFCVLPFRSTNDACASVRSLGQPLARDAKDSSLCSE